MHRLLATCSMLTLALATLMPASAVARNDGVRPVIGTPRVQLGNDGRIRVNHPNTGAMLIGPQAKVYDTRGVKPSLRVVPVRRGFNLIATYRNTRSSSQPLGSLVLPGLAIDQQATWYDFRRGSERLEYDHANTSIVRGGHSYPSDLYSPVAVVADENIAIGASLLYNPLEYQHEVVTQLRSKGFARTTPAGPGEPDRDWRWQVVFMLRGDIAPGETREYTLAVRFDRPSNYMDTLQPYADYFAQTHGPVAYVKDPRPVKGYSAAQNHDRSAANPRGFGYGDRRPDQFGFEPWANHLREEAASSGYDRTMIWALSGLHRNDAINFPPNFASGIAEYSPARRTRGQLRTLRNEGISIGLWWGRSQQIMEGWHSDHIEYLDPNNQNHVRTAMNELAAAERFGPREIGLDAFVYLPLWEAVPWFERLQEAMPDTRFITEPSACDILHRLGPTWVEANVITKRHTLADLVNPGHETWASVRFDLLERSQGALSPEQRRDELERLVDLGMVPVLMGQAPLPRNIPESGSVVEADEPSDVAHNEANGKTQFERNPEETRRQPGWLRRQATHPPE